MEDLNDILNPPQQEEVTSEVGEEQEQEQQQEATTGADVTQVAAETQQEVKEEKEDPAAIRAALRAELEAEKAAEMAALAKERERVRAKAAELEAKLAQKPEEEKKPDFWDDPEARLAAERQQFEQVLRTQRLEFSEMLARQAHSDYQEKFDTFAALVQENPALFDQMNKQPNPAEWAYEQASKHLKMKQLEAIGDPQEYEKQIRERVKAELAAEQAAEAERQRAAAVEETIAKKLPKTGFAELRSVGSPSTKKQTFDGPPSLEAILKT